MGDRSEPYGTHEYEWVHPSKNPRWLLREPLEGARYCVINGIAFETMRGAFFGYFVDRVTMAGEYLGESCWFEKWTDAKAAMHDWSSRPTNFLGEYEMEDVYGDEDGNPTAVGLAKQRARNNSDRHGESNKMRMRAVRSIEREQVAA